MNKALLEQLALAKEAGTKAMAKDFFAKPENAAEGAPDDAQASSGGEAEPDLTPEQLQELMQLLQAEANEPPDNEPMPQG